LSANEAGLLISAMAAVLPECSMYGGALYAVYPSARRVPAKVRLFIEALNAELNGGRRSVR